ncbi:6-phosphogluconolactonase [Aeromicrobium duanguangcaii]|uniref:6-phosphogluconolactonase n=1 Tax=Aeromicrobium duanguangcaii TaxID=2968086 RepID=A0ABY5KCZ4_9ACTN|nr:6-phosphogluconolactonase [Aeromicrobium duanguangcaii]UUI67316.1 6-phosphogluconolactonase [Aeromicrobium duanguangcaii]
MTIRIFDSGDDLALAVSRQLAARVQSIQLAGRTPRLVLTGGSIATKIYGRLSAESGARWSAAHYWWGDERFVPEGHEDRNDRQAREGFLDRLAVPDDHIHAMPAHGCELSMADAADAYAEELPEEAFDVVLLGVGPDAHIASLFPGHPQVHERERLAVEVLDSPKPPPQRITLTYPALNHTRATWFVVSGADKAEAVAKAMSGVSIDEAPAAGARGIEETVWFLDSAAAAKLPR